MMPVRRFPVIGFPVIVLLVAMWLTAPRAQVRPTYSDGVAGLLQKLQALRTTASLLYVAAHPDDEDSALLAAMAAAANIGGSIICQTG